MHEAFLYLAYEQDKLETEKNIIKHKTA